MKLRRREGAGEIKCAASLGADLVEMLRLS